MRKNVLKRMLAFGLAVVVCTMSWTVEPKADDTLTEGDFKYTVLEDGTAEITKYVGVQGVQEIVVPEQIGGHEVTSIGRESFWGDGANTKSIIIPKSVTTIGALAFWQCDDLEKFTIPESVTTIGASAFDGCTSLKNIVIPKNVSTIGANPFSGCSIEAIEVAKENTVYHSESNCLLDSKGTLISAGKNFVIPDQMLFVNISG